MEPARTGAASEIEDPAIAIASVVSWDGQGVAVGEVLGATQERGGLAGSPDVGSWVTIASAICMVWAIWPAYRIGCGWPPLGGEMVTSLMLRLSQPVSLERDMQDLVVRIARPSYVASLHRVPVAGCRALRERVLVPRRLL